MSWFNEPVLIGPVSTYGASGARRMPWATLLIGEAPNRWMQDNGRMHIALLREDLAEWCGLDLISFAKLFVRCNLLQSWPGKAASGKGDHWPIHEARQFARALTPHLEGNFARVVLVGKRVAQAFDLPGATFWEWTTHPYRTRELPRVAVVPHPSKSNRMWNDPKNREAAGAFWSALASQVLGEIREAGPVLTGNPPKELKA